MFKKNIPSSSEPSMTPEVSDLHSLTFSHAVRPEDAKLLALLSKEDPTLNLARPLPDGGNYFAPSRELRAGLTVRSIAGMNSVEVAVDGLRLCSEIFQSADTTGRLAQTYRKLLAGKPSESADDQPFGTQLEWSCFSVYYLNDSPAAIGGLYRYREHLESIWLGRFGVSGQARGTGLAGEIFHYLEGDAVSIGGTKLSAFTESDNAVAIRFYETQGMERSPDHLNYAGHDNIIMVKTI